jgi:hypothetical protein
MYINYLRSNKDNNVIDSVILLILILFIVIGFIINIIIGIIFIIILISQFTICKGSIIDFNNKSIFVFREILWFKIKKSININDYNAYRVKKIIIGSSYSSRSSNSTVVKRYYSLEIFNTNNGLKLEIATDDKKYINEISTKLENIFNYANQSN